jgi:hypothetical protein
MNTLIVDDNDLECDCKDLTLDNLTVKSLGFIPSDLDKFGLIIYTGKRGTKIIRSKYFMA